MLSVCCAALNAKFDFGIFLEHLAAHNQDVDYEVCLCHDDRVEDHSAEYFADLQGKHRNLKIIKNTHETTVKYLTDLVNYYDRHGKFKTTFRDALRDNIAKFSEKRLFDHRRSFLWLTSSVLYNKAVSIASGSTLIITPGDFIYGFKLKNLADFVGSNQKKGYGYWKPHAIWGRITNASRDWIRNHVSEVNRGIGFREGFRHDSNQVFRSILRASNNLSDYCLPDFRNNRCVNLADPDSMAQMAIFNEESLGSPHLQNIRNFHGFHILTRPTYDAIGGFSEIHSSRAWSDDYFSYQGRKYSLSELPSEFSIYWCGQHELLRFTGEKCPDDWREILKKVDPWCDEHPIPGTGDNPTYIYQGLVPNHTMAEWANTEFPKTERPVRIAQ